MPRWLVLLKILRQKAGDVLLDDAPCKNGHDRREILEWFHPAKNARPDHRKGDGRGLRPTLGSSKSCSPAELPRRAHTEPYLTLSRHTALGCGD